jgi:hypothetical protein
MGEGISIDLGSALPYMVDRLLTVFGKDSATAEWRLEITRMVRLSNEQASHVQCVGMPRPTNRSQVA